jgi:hypothetical protein
MSDGAVVPLMERVNSCLAIRFCHKLYRRLFWPSRLLLFFPGHLRFQEMTYHFSNPSGGRMPKAAS